MRRSEGHLRTLPITRNQIELLVSVRSDPTSMERDVKRAELLKSAVVQNGMVCTDGRQWRAIEPEQKIRQRDPDFQHPGEVVECLLNFHRECVCYQQNQGHCLPDCQDRLSRWPILSQGQVHHLILSFERRPS